jgi:transcriptional regulator with XRE-family HTH domain
MLLHEKYPRKASIMSTHTLMRIDGQKLRRLRERRVWLIGDLAEKSGVHRNLISSYEHGKSGAHPDTIRKLAKALDVDPAELIGE